MDKIEAKRRVNECWRAQGPGTIVDKMVALLLTIDAEARQDENRLALRRTADAAAFRSRVTP